MPRTKVTSSSKASSKTTSKAVKVVKAVKAIKKPVKKIIADPKRKKIKKVIVDIIEDEEIPSSSSKTSKENSNENFNDNEDEIYNSLVTEKYEDEPITDELDSQKNFFSQLSREVKDKKSNEDGLEEYSDEKEVRPAKHVGLYRKLVWKFLIATVILLGIVFYFSFSKLTIAITPKGEVLNDSLFLKVSAAGSAEDNSIKNNNDPRTPIEGEIKQFNSPLEAVYPATGEELGTVVLSGQVKIINNNNKNQALVATTRILSPDNKLFRIKDAVNVPAGGEVTVDIYADKPSEELAIGPTSFTIPGLWSGLQDKIFARSEKEFTYDKLVKKFIKQTDIENATKDINQRLMDNASSTLSSKDDNLLYSVSDKTKITFSAKAGDMVDQFSAKAQGNIIGISFSRSQAVKLVTAKLRLLVPDDKELIEFKPDNIVYTLDSYDSTSKTATIKASFSGTMALKADSTIINREQLVNLSSEQIDKYLKDFPEIKSYELKFFPSFVKRAPGLVDRINVVINKDK